MAKSGIVHRGKAASTADTADITEHSGEDKCVPDEAGVSYNIDFETGKVCAVFFYVNRDLSAAWGHHRSVGLLPNVPQQCLLDRVVYMGMMHLSIEYAFGSLRVLLRYLCPSFDSFLVL